VLRFMGRGGGGFLALFGGGGGGARRPEVPPVLAGVTLPRLVAGDADLARWEFPGLLLM
jgi:hypothetical protein